MRSDFIKLGKLGSGLALICFIVLFVQARLGNAVEENPVGEAQTLLSELDYFPGPIDGILGPRTLRALRDFQRANGLPLTQGIDSKTLHLLRATSEELHLMEGERNTVPASRVSPVDMISPVTGSAAGPAASPITGVPTAYAARSAELEPIVGVARAVAVFVVTVATATLALGLLGLIGAFQSVSQRVRMFISLHARPIVAKKVEVCRNMLPESSLWRWRTGSFFVDAVVKRFSTITFPRKLQGATRRLQSLVGKWQKSRFWQRVTESVHYWSNTDVSREVRFHEGCYPSYPDHRQYSSTCAARHHTDRLGTAKAVSFTSGEPVPVEPCQTDVPTETKTLGHTLPGNHIVNATAEPESCASVLESRDTSLQTAQEASHRNGMSGSNATYNTPGQERSPVDDPLAALSVHLAFERFDEAEALAKNAVEQYPERHEYRVRLLQVYHEAGNRVGFEYHAKALRAAVGSDSPMMAMVAEWWRDLVPNEALFLTSESQQSTNDEQVQQERRDSRGTRVARH
jgi:hypothetical protein